MSLPPLVSNQLGAGLEPDLVPVSVPNSCKSRSRTVFRCRPSWWITLDDAAEDVLVSVASVEDVEDVEDWDVETWSRPSRTCPLRWNPWLPQSCRSHRLSPRCLGGRSSRQGHRGRRDGSAVTEAVVAPDCLRVDQQGRGCLAQRGQRGPDAFLPSDDRQQHRWSARCSRQAADRVAGNVRWSGSSRAVR